MYADETDKIVDAIRENAKNINKMIKERKQHPDSEMLLKHVSTDDHVLTNITDQTDIEKHSTSQKEIGTLNADISEMQKIKSVGKYCVRILLDIK